MLLFLFYSASLANADPIWPISPFRHPPPIDQSNPQFPWRPIQSGPNPALNFGQNGWSRVGDGFQPGHSQIRSPFDANTAPAGQWNFANAAVHRPFSFGPAFPLASQFIHQPCQSPFCVPTTVGNGNGFVNGPVGRVGPVQPQQNSANNLAQISVPTGGQWRGGASERWFRRRSGNGGQLDTNEQQEIVSQSKLENVNGTEWLKKA